MADRTVTTTLKAKVTDYVAGMKVADKATASVTEELQDAARAGDDFGDESALAAAKAAAAFRTVGSAAAALDDRIEATQRTIRDLALQIAATDDVAKRADLEKAFGSETRLLNKLRRIRGSLDEVGDEATEAARKMADLGAGTGLEVGVGTGGVLVKLFSRSIGSPLTLALAGAAMAAAPAIGSIVGGAIVAGVGTAGVGAAVAAAFTDGTARQAAKDLGQDVLTDIAAIAQRSLVKPVLESIGEIRAAWRENIRGEVEATLTVASQFQDELVDAGLGFVRGILPGLRSMIENAQPIFDVLRDDLPALGRALGRTFAMLGEHSDAFAVGLRDALVLIEGTVAAAAFLVTYLAEAYKFVRSFSPLVELLFPEPEKDLGTVREFAATAPAALRDTASAADEARQRLDDMFDAWEEGVEKAFALEEAQDAIANAVARLREQMKEQRDEHVKGAGTLDRSTQAGRDNAAAVRDLVGMYADLARENSTAGRSNAGLRDQLIKTLTKLGLSAAAAQAYADALNKIPTSKTTTVTVKFVSNLDRYHAPTLAPGQYGQFAKGGIQAAQHGLITKSPTVLFGERGTGAEAFIPKLGISQQRAFSLLNTAAGWHGMRVAPQTAPAGTGAGLDGRAVARQFARDVARALDGATIHIDDSGRGRITAVTADLYRRGG